MSDRIPIENVNSTNAKQSPARTRIDSTDSSRRSPTTPGLGSNRKSKSKHQNVSNLKSTPRSKAAGNSPARSNSNSSRKYRASQPPMTEEEISQKLVQLIVSKKFFEASQWIDQNACLKGKYHISDVAKYALNQKKFDIVGQIIRTFKLQENQLLVTLFVKDLIQNGRIHLAVRYAQDFVGNFPVKDGGKYQTNVVSEKPSWTPQTLIQAMIQVRQFKAALEYAKKFGLLDIFPPRYLIMYLIQDQEWMEAFKYTREFKLYDQFPLEDLVNNMLSSHMWKNALKSIQDGGEELKKKFPPELVVNRMCKAGQFINAIETARNLKLVPSSEERNTQLASNSTTQMIVMVMIEQKEYYKAIKYSHKFGLDNMEEFSAVRLIQHAIDSKYYHVALYYIRKLKLYSQFKSQIDYIIVERQRMKLIFEKYMQYKVSKVNSDPYQRQLKALIGDDTEMVEVTTSVLEQISVTEEVIPRKVKATRNPAECDEDEDEQIVFLGNRKQDSRGSIGPPNSKHPAQPGQKETFNFAAFTAQVEAARTSAASAGPSNPSTDVTSKPAKDIDVASLAMQFHSATPASHVPTPLAPNPGPSFHAPYPHPYPFGNGAHPPYAPNYNSNYNANYGAQHPHQ